MGVTGARTTVSDGAAALVARTQDATDPAGRASGSACPPAEQAAEVASYADGVIVGSAFVRCLLESDTPAEGAAAAGRLAARLAAGVRRRLAS